MLAEHVRLHAPVAVTLPWHDPRDPKMHGKPVTRELVFTWHGHEAIIRQSFNPVWAAPGGPLASRIGGP